VRPVVVVDAGDFGAKSDTIADGVMFQSRAKAHLQLESFALGGLDAITFGEEDFALGVDWLLATAKELSLPLVSANLHCGDTTFTPWKVVERGDLKVGITAITAPEQAGTCTASDPIRSVKQAVADMGPVDVVVVLAHEKAEADAALVTAVPAVKVVVNGHGKVKNDDPKPLPGHAVQLGSGSRGKYVGLARIAVVPDAVGFEATGGLDALKERQARMSDRVEKAKKDLEEASNHPTQPNADAGKKKTNLNDASRLHSQLEYYQKQLADVETEIALFSKAPEGALDKIVNMNHPAAQDVPNDPAVQALVDATLAEITRHENEGSTAVVALDDSPFVGAEACKSCHAAQYAQWQTQDHAHAMQALAKDGHERDASCFACHSTGAFHPKGPQLPSQMTSAYENVQCEACHGPGKDHVAEQKPGQMNLADDASTCTICHDGDRDGGRFDYATYLPKVTH
jgi:2',3'-cyclic-nucleotide 2'-phosphodiesterase (5'-nucleotidase family)